MLMGEVPLGYTQEAWQRYPDQVQPADSNGNLALFDADGPGFGDLLDVINPLQHIPVISSIYREVTGDDIGAAARVMGGTLYGGPVGLAAAIINIALEETSGEDIGGNMIAALFGDETTAADGDTPVALAAADETAAARDADKTTAAANLAAATEIAGAAVEVPWINPDSLPVDPPGGPATNDTALAEARAIAALISPAAGPAAPGPLSASARRAAATLAAAGPATDAAARDPNRHPEAPGRPVVRERPAASGASVAPVASSRPAAVENPLSDPMAGNIAASMLGALEQYERLMRDRQGAGRTVDIDS